MTCGDLSPVGVLRSIINTYRPPLLTNDDQRSPSAPTPVPRSSPVPPTRTVFFRSPGVTGRMQRGGGTPTPTVLDGLGLRRHQLPAPPPVRPSERQNRLVPILEEIMGLRDAANQLGEELQDLYRRLDRELADHLAETARSRDSPSDNYMPTMSPLRKTTISFMVRDIFLRFANICKKRQIKTDARRKRSSEEKLTKTKKLRVKSYVTGNGCQQRPHHRNVSPRSDQRRMDGHPLFSVNIGQCLTYHDSVYSCLVHPDCTCNRLSTPHTVRY